MGSSQSTTRTSASPNAAVMASMSALSVVVTH